MKTAKTFGQTIRDLRNSRDPRVSLRDLAEKVSGRTQKSNDRKFHYSYLSKIEKDQTPPPSNVAITAIAEELGTDPDELLVMAGKVPPDLDRIYLDSPGARRFFRLAIGEGLHDTEWEKLMGSLRRLIRKRSPRRAVKGRAGDSAPC